MSDKVLHIITFKKDHKGSAEVVLNLPNGGRKRFNKFQKNKKADDYPSVECPLDATEIRQLTKHGFACTPVKAKKVKE